MAEVPLQTLLLDRGVRSVNFFNGRLLSGEDLGDERTAGREIDARLGRALGTGIGAGLFVLPPAAQSLTRPTVEITPGLAVAPSGRTLQLSSAVTLLLTRPDTADDRPGEFGTCLPPQGTAYVAGAGVYLLTITCGRAPQGLVPVSGLGNGPAACNSKYLVEGVQFRLVQLPVTSEALGDPDVLRNRLA
ncbi:MAG TPA: hypothetical protein VKE74_29450, partial [Gemmataceae bacterium]|nr:hypothetical protein [Gemmataceae bacterium]